MTEQQQNVLSELIHKARDTRFGRRYNFRNIHSYEEFSEQVPIHFYDDLKTYLDDIKKGKPDVLWPGTISSFAVSSGTTGAGKHLPLSRDRLKSDKLFMRKVARAYLKQRPNLFSLLGKHISLPGSIEQNNRLSLGEISGFSAHHAPFWLKPFQLISPKELTELSFSQKFDKVIDKALTADVSVITAVPSWILTLFQEVLKRSGCKNIAEVWPDLQLLICGGVKLANYRPHLEQLAGPLNLDFIETYGASEGYFAYSDDLSRDDLHLVTGNGVFYEFIQDPLPDRQALSIQPAQSLADVKPGVPYAMLVSTNAGLWRYAVRDIIEFTSVNPPRILVKGRLSKMLDSYGEGLYMFEAEEALKKTAENMNLNVCTFTVASRLDSENDIPRHHWYIQLVDPVHADTLNRLAGEIDSYIQRINRHYAIRRESRALGKPIVKSITQVQINNWLEIHGKNKAQGKLPRILPDGSDLSPFL